MILGIGNDLVDRRRIEKVLQRHGERFIRRCFTAVEHDRAVRAGQNRASDIYAKRFAAKEACAKALGTGFGRYMQMKEIGVENNEHGQPVLVLTGGARERLAALTPPGKMACLHLSLSDESPLAQAFVVIEAR